MRKFLLGLAVGVVLTFLTALVLIFSAARFGNRRPTVANESTLILNLSGDIPEKAPVELPWDLFGGGTTNTVHEVWYALQKAASDPRIKAVVLRAGNMDAGWAKLEELRSDLVSFKRSGKPLIAYLRAPRTREYFVATAADRIYVSPEDMVDVKGLRAEVMFFKKTLDKLGVEMEVEHVGRFKDAGDMLTATTMTPESRQALDAVLNGIYSSILRGISSGRKRSLDEAQGFINDGPYTASQAARRGLVDELRYEDQVYGELKTQLKQSELKRISLHDYLGALGPDQNGRKIAFIVGEGTILRGQGSDGLMSDEGFTSGSFIRMLRDAANDKDVKGVILRVDSPGGDAFASDEILREVKLLRDKKPMVISMSDAAASGGYYVSMTGDPVIAYGNTLTGSIGVLWGKANLRGLYDKIGVQKEILMRGQNADVDTDYHPLTAEARAKLRSGLEEFYHGFVQKVADGRKRKYNEVEPLAQGRVWLGSDAKANGLVDEIGGLDQALNALRRKAGIASSEKVRLVPYPRKRSLWEQWIRSKQDTAVESRIRSVLGNLDYRLWLTGGFMRIMPYSLGIH